MFLYEACDQKNKCNEVEVVKTNLDIIPLGTFISENPISFSFWCLILEVVF